MRNLFSVGDRVIVITGAAGILGSAMVRHFAEQGAQVVVLDRNLEAGERLAAEVAAEGGRAAAYATDVLDRASLVENHAEIMDRFGRIDVLINAAGGNMPGATIPPDKTFFDLDPEAVRKVVDLNLFGTILPTMVFARAMTERGEGSIINIASESALRPLTRVAGYGAAKAAVVNFTRYMCGELATKFPYGAEPHAADESRRKSHAPGTDDSGPYALRAFRRARGAARHAAMACERRVAFRFGNADGDRRRIRRLLDLNGLDDD